MAHMSCFPCYQMPLSKVMYHIDSQYKTLQLLLFLCYFSAFEMYAKEIKEGSRNVNGPEMMNGQNGAYYPSLFWLEAFMFPCYLHVFFKIFMQCLNK